MESICYVSEYAGTFMASLTKSQIEIINPSNNHAFHTSYLRHSGPIKQEYPPCLSVTNAFMKFPSYELLGCDKKYCPMCQTKLFEAYIFAAAHATSFEAPRKAEP